MFKINTKAQREVIREYLIEASADYAADCLEKENPTDKEIMDFVVGDISRVMSHRKVYGFMPEPAIKSYLQGLSLAVDFYYKDEWELLEKWSGEKHDFYEAKEKEIGQADEKYWHLLAMEIGRWFNN